VDLMKALMSRRTVRRWKGEPPSEDAMKEVVRAGMFAASAGNGQPWRFVIVLDAAKVEKVTDALGWLGGEPGSGERPRAHVVILTPEGASWAAQADAAAAAQNMQLAAVALGLGSCWFGSIKRAAVAELLSVPDSWHIFSIVSFGEPAEEPVLEAGSGRPSRDEAGVIHVPKKPLDEVCSVDKFKEAPSDGQEEAQ